MHVYLFFCHILYLISEFLTATAVRITFSWHGNSSKEAMLET